MTTDATDYTHAEEEARALIEAFLAQHIKSADGLGVDYQGMAEEMARLPGAGNPERLRWTLERAASARTPDRCLAAMLRHPDRYQMLVSGGKEAQAQAAWVPLYRYECCDWRCPYSVMRYSKSERPCRYCGGPMRLDPEAYRMRA